MTTNRRQFINRSITISGCAFLPEFLRNTSLYAAQQSQENILVVLQLSGGNDGLNTLIPYEEEKYYDQRPTLAVGKQRVIKLEQSLGLHPNLKPFAKLYEKNQLTIVNGVGYPNPDRSHFSSMDIWHTAKREVTYRSKGWIGNLFDHTNPGSNALNGLHLGKEQRPRALDGSSTPAPSIESVNRFRLDLGRNDSVRYAIDKHLKSPRENANSLLNFVQSSMTSAISASDQIQSATKEKASNAVYPNRPLARKLQVVSQLIKANLNCRVYYVTLNGFDTHSQQDVSHPNLMSEVGESLAAFQKDLNDSSQSDRVLTMVFSEFGRRLKENASKGTDHGAAAPMFLMGSKVKGGMVGKQPSLHQLTDGDVKFHTDFRSVYATILDDWFGVEHKTILDESYQKLDLLQV